MKKERLFKPTEIIFALTDACNMRCSHCYVSKQTNRLPIDRALNFLDSCKDSDIERIGFSGGEPFLYLDFITSITKKAISLDLMFDRIMTNGDWWKSEEDLYNRLEAVYEAGFDGKIGLSYDSFHNQDIDRIVTFIKAVHKTFGPESLEIQSVISSDLENAISDLENIETISLKLNLEVETYLNKKGKGRIILSNEEIYLPIDREVQSFMSNDNRTWQSSKWFKDDYCEGPGQILFIHPKGDIAPCCGFSNENPQLFIGTIDNNLEEVLYKAQKNPYINLCYTQGLKKGIKLLKKQHIKIPGKTEDLCAFCDFVCNNLKNL